jgi:hypothetical protein
VAETLLVKGPIERMPCVLIEHDLGMGSDGSKPRKEKHKLPKVPKNEEPNRAEGFTGGSFGRSGHSSDGHQTEEPGRAGAFLLRLLGRRPKT